MRPAIALAALLVALLAAPLAVPARAQSDAPVKLLWRQTLEASAPEGRVQASFVPIFAQGDEVVVALTEALDPSARPKMRAFIERLGPQGVLWRYELRDLPPGTLLETTLSPPAADGHALLAVTFQTDKAPVGGEYGRLLSIDLGSGAVERVIPLRYPKIPQSSKPDGEDRLHVFGALRLANGQALLYGGSGVGPYRWFAGLRGVDGSFLWDAGAPPRGYGEVHGARETPDGIELLIQAIAYTPDYGDRHLLVRLDRQGKTLSTTVLARLSSSEITLLGADRLLVVERDGRAWIRDRNRKDTELARFRAGTSLIDQVGPWLVFAHMTGRHWFISAEGRRLDPPEGIDGLPVEGRYALGANGRPVKYVLQQKCTDEPAQGECRRLELALARVEF